MGRGLSRPGPDYSLGRLRALALKVRASLIDAGLARKTVNDHVQFLKRMFRWAVCEELVPPSVHHGLTAVAGLKAGESSAPEPRKVTPISEDLVVGRAFLRVWPIGEVGFL